MLTILFFCRREVDWRTRWTLFLGAIGCSPVFNKHGGLSPLYNPWYHNSSRRVDLPPPSRGGREKTSTNRSWTANFHFDLTNKQFFPFFPFVCFFSFVKLIYAAFQQQQFFHKPLCSIFISAQDYQANCALCSPFEIFPSAMPPPFMETWAFPAWVAW